MLRLSALLKDGRVRGRSAYTASSEKQRQCIQVRVASEEMSGERYMKCMAKWVDGLSNGTS